ncbi:hypothetical protein BpHYR1_039103, partial [Brachionus plicatilis]
MNFYLKVKYGIKIGCIKVKLLIRQHCLFKSTVLKLTQIMFSPKIPIDFNNGIVFRHLIFGQLKKSLNLIEKKLPYLTQIDLGTICQSPSELNSAGSNELYNLLKISKTACDSKHKTRVEAQSTIESSFELVLPQFLFYCHQNLSQLSSNLVLNQNRVGLIPVPADGMRTLILFISCDSADVRLLKKRFFFGILTIKNPEQELFCECYDNKDTIELNPKFWGYGSTTPNEVKKPRISDSGEGCFKALGNVLRASSNG